MCSRCLSVTVILLLVLCACKREQRNLRPSPTRLAVFGDSDPESTPQPGGSQPPHIAPSPSYWQLVAYVRSMNQEQPQAATPKRTDILEPNPQTIHNKVPGTTK